MSTARKNPLIDLRAKRIKQVQFQNIFERTYFENLYVFLKHLYLDRTKIEIDKLFDATLFNPL